MKNWPKNLILDGDELTTNFSSRYFKAIVDVRFLGTKELGIKQRNMLNQFISKESKVIKDAVGPVIDYYNKVYPFYYEGWSSAGLGLTQIEAVLPRLMTEEKLLELVSDVELFIEAEELCSDGNFAISMECEWDVEHGLGLKFNNWIVIEVGTAQIAFL